MSVELNNSDRSAFLIINDSSYELKKKNTLGSAKTADIPISGEGIAEKHCILRVNSSVVSLMDLGSESGTLVEQKKLEPGRQVLITEDDELQIGECFGKIIFKESKNVKNSSPPTDEIGTSETPSEKGEFSFDESDDLDLELGNREQSNLLEESDNNAGYELSFNPNMKEQMEEIKDDSAESEELDLDLGSEEEEFSDPDTQVLNEETIILKRTDQVPVSEKLEKFREEKKDSGKSTKSLLKKMREGGEKKKSTAKIKMTPITKFAGVNLRFFSMLIDLFTIMVTLSFLKETEIIRY